jgi:hypothetical protein
VSFERGVVEHERDDGWSKQDVVEERRSIVLQWRYDAGEQQSDALLKQDDVFDRRNVVLFFEHVVLIFQHVVEE